MAPFVPIPAWSRIFLRYAVGLLFRDAEKHAPVDFGTFIILIGRGASLNLELRNPSEILPRKERARTLPSTFIFGARRADNSAPVPLESFSKTAKKTELLCCDAWWKNTKQKTKKERNDRSCIQYRWVEKFPIDSGRTWIMTSDVMQLYYFYTLTI